MKKQKKDYLALALDNVTEKEKILNLVEQTKKYIGIFKIGLEQYIRFGPEIIHSVQKSGNKIFLDLKLLDIPNTVAKAVYAASELKVDYLTIHTTGGLVMMKAAAEIAKSCDTPPKLIGVTVLTSIDQYALNNELKVDGTVAEQVAHLAQLAVQAELDGIVCSAAELPEIKRHIPDGFEVITPGIRPAGTETGDQKRVVTPQQSIDNGATTLVIGRPINAAENPGKSAMNIYNDLYPRVK